jgi:hypothetical protein
MTKCIRDNGPWEIIGPEEAVHDLLNKTVLSSRRALDLGWPHGAVAPAAGNEPHIH